MTQEALKLALEALEANYLLVNGTETHGGLEQCLDGYYSGCFDTDSINKQTEEAIAAIKEALAHPEQEPVAWVCYGAPGKRDIDFEEADINGLPIGTSLYTTPPQRTWVGLTDEERNDCLVDADPCECLADPEAEELMRCIEAKLKQKNGYAEEKNT